MKNYFEKNEDCENTEDTRRSIGDGTTENYVEFFRGYKEAGDEGRESTENTELDSEFYEKYQCGEDLRLRRHLKIRIRNI
ncbi:MAG: hypothetical protein ACLS5W_09780 [Coprococcus sp.]